MKARTWFEWMRGSPGEPRGVESEGRMVSYTVTDRDHDGCPTDIEFAAENYRDPLTRHARPIPDNWDPAIVWFPTFPNSRGCGSITVPACTAG